MKLPHSTHTVITLIIALLLSVLFIFGYLSMVNPNDKQALKYDQQREEDFEKLKKSIQGYYTKKDKMPESLEALKEEVERDTEAKSTDSLDALTGLLAYKSVPSRDPYSNRPYSYKIENTTSTKYQLCTQFFKENKGDDESVDKGGSAVVKHGTGNQCIDFEVKKKTIRTYSPSFQTAPYSRDGLTEEDKQQLIDELNNQYDSGKKKSTSDVQH